MDPVCFDVEVLVWNFCGGGKSAADVYDHTIVCGDILVNVLVSLRPL